MRLSYGSRSGVATHNKLVSRQRKNIPHSRYSPERNCLTSRGISSLRA